MSELFFGGMPTKKDIDQLMADVKAIPGTSITYDAVCKIIGVGYRTNRFRTVTNAWRKQLFRDYGVQTEASGNKFTFLTADQAQDKGRDGLSKTKNMVRRVRVKIEAIDANDLTTSQKRDYHTLLRRQAMMLHDTAEQACKEIAPPKPHSSARPALCAVI